ncbi:MAG: hypothetical protein AVO35_09595 [Candidatus Aegiribacteria sp. MLS_C]|nr:MAG: hypothetical protein AVO35_09595 [Candidatus Aegiribacteria sp. MLS_C]
MIMTNMHSLDVQLVMFSLAVIWRLWYPVPALTLNMEQYSFISGMRKHRNGIAQNLKRIQHLLIQEKPCTPTFLFQFYCKVKSDPRLL